MENRSWRDKRRSKGNGLARLVVQQREDNGLNKDPNGGGEDDSVA